MAETLGHYKILDRIGAGGMGEVYRARDTRLGRTVAIKVLAPGVAGDPARRERLMREARAAAALSHPNIAALYEIGDDQGQLFLVFEFVPGVTLSTVIGGRPLNPRRAVDFAVQIADALADAHSEGIAHRDIKPANIIITPKDKAKILDFGLATWTTGGAERERTAHDATVLVTGAGTALGTVAYMSPEQALGEPVDPRTDIFSLGVVLFEMLTGRRPFAGTTPTAVALQVVQAPAPAPTAVNRVVPRELDAIVGKALAKSIDHRYESAATLAAELRSVAAILDVRSELSEAAGAAVPVVPIRRSIGGSIAALLVAAAVGTAAWVERGSVERIWRRTMGPPPSPVIAVIPFETDADQTFFADGLADDLITRLGQTAGLKVIGRSATRTYRGRTPRDVARDTGAAAILTGSVRPAGDTVKISLELVNPSDNTAIWSSQSVREVKDIFAVQAQLATEVAIALRLKLQPTASSARAASRTVDPRAYDLYLHGRHASAERRLPEAIGFYQQAIAADAGLGEAFAGIAEALHLQVTFSGAPADAAYHERLTAAARRAFEIDPDLPQANVAMGLASEGLADALKYFRHAIEIDASYAEANHLVGDAIHDFDPERALAFFRRALALDPHQDAIHADIVGALGLLGRDDDARAEAAAAARVGGFGAAVAANMLELNTLHAGRYAQAAAALSARRGVRSSAAGWAALVGAIRLAGRVDDAFTEATALAAHFPQDCEARVMLAALRAERHEAAAAHKLVDGVLAVLRFEAPLASDFRCGLHAAAAVQNPVEAAALLERISANEPLLRAFSEVVMGESGTAWIDARLYPWSLVARHPAVAQARERLDAAYARERETAHSVLAGLP